MCDNYCCILLLHMMKLTQKCLRMVKKPRVRTVALFYKPFFHTQKHSRTHGIFRHFNPLVPLGLIKHKILIPLYFLTPIVRFVDTHRLSCIGIQPRVVMAAWACFIVSFSRFFAAKA